MILLGSKLKILTKLQEVLSADGYYQVEVVTPRSKRNNEQNKMLWKLIHKIAKATQQDDMEVYAEVLERADAASDYIITEKEITDELRKAFRGVKFIRYQEVNGKTRCIYKVYLGSSKMTTKEMAELLDVTQAMAAELGVDYGKPF